MPVLLVCTREPAAPGGEADGLYPRVKSSLQQVLARHGRPIVIVNGEVCGSGAGCGVHYPLGSNLMGPRRLGTVFGVFFLAKSKMHLNPISWLDMQKKSILWPQIWLISHF